MRSIKESHPEEPDLSYICRDYMVMCDEYPGVYQFLQFLNKLRYCDFTEKPQDWFTFRDGIIQSHWIIFVSCLPKDMHKLRHIANHFNYCISIVEEDEECDQLLPF